MSIEGNAAISEAGAAMSAEEPTAERIGETSGRQHHRRRPVAGFSLTFLTAWSASPIPWRPADVIALLPLVLGVGASWVADALLDPDSSPQALPAAIRVFLAGLIFVGIGVARRSPSTLPRCRRACTAARRPRGRRSARPWSTRSSPAFRRRCRSRRASFTPSTPTPSSSRSSSRRRRPTPASTRRRRPSSPSRRRRRRWSISVSTRSST